MTSKSHQASVVQFFSNFCHAAFFPLLGLWLFKEHLFPTTESALIVSAGVFSNRLAAVFFAKIVRRHHKKFIIMGALSSISILHTLFFFLVAHRIVIFPLWFAFAVLVGSMLSITSLSLSAYATSHALENDQDRNPMRFALLSTAVNLSAGVGPFIGAAALEHSQHLFLLLPILFALVSILACSLLARDKKREIQPSHDTPSSPVNPKFVLLIILNILTFVAYPQFYEVLPVYASQAMDQEAIGGLFVISGLVIVLFQIPITKLIGRLPSSLSIALSNLILAGGTILFIPARDGCFTTCVLGTILISVAESIYGPVYQSLAIQLFNPGNQVLGLAILSVAWGVAEAAAAFVGLFAVGHGYGYVSLVIGAMAAVVVSFTGFLACYRSSRFGEPSRLDLIHTPA